MKRKKTSSQRVLVPVHKVGPVTLLISGLREVGAGEVEECIVVAVTRCEQRLVVEESLRRHRSGSISSLRLDVPTRQSFVRGGRPTSLSRKVWVVRVRGCKRLRQVVATSHEHGLARITHVERRSDELLRLWRHRHGQGVRVQSLRSERVAGYTIRIGS
jgi:hypothetical protein